jgi:peptidoglycan/xylan/chitin deacetylase (PgdA/CDA1 family)
MISFKEATWMNRMNEFACLTYHVIGDREDQYAVNERQLRDHLRFLKGEGFKVEGFEQLEARLRSKVAWPDRYAVLTLDDGHETSMVAADILEEQGCQATFFVTRDRSEAKPGYIRASEIRELRQRGFSFGTHGTTHQKLTFLPERYCIAEMGDSKQWLEDLLGERISYMAAPGGFINARVFRQAKDLGYVLVGTCHEKTNAPRGMMLPCLVNRVNVRRQFSLRNIRRIVYGSFPFYLWRQLRSAALAIPKQILRD